MSYYNICTSCGAHLDPGEPCDCSDGKKPEVKRPEKIHYQPRYGIKSMSWVKQHAG